MGVSYADTTDYGVSAYIAHIGHAVSASRDRKCDIVLITLAGRPRSRGQVTGSSAQDLRTFQDSFERIYDVTNITMYGMAAQCHMHEYGTTSEQFAEIRVASFQHTQ